MNPTSTTYTMGTALSYAQDNQVPVALLVEGQWMRGHVAAIDGHGVVLDSDRTEHCVVNIESVSALRVMTVALTLTTTPALCLAVLVAVRSYPLTS